MLHICNKSLLIGFCLLGMAWHSVAFGAESGATLGTKEADIRISSTIGPVDAGIIPALATAYTQKNGVTISFEGAGTGATLEKAKTTGKFDMVVVHARALEDAFVSEGWGRDRRDIMYNDFVILGPVADTAQIKGMKDATKALQVIADKKIFFVTRGDNSGTHVKEMELWAKSGVVPTGEWYHAFVDGKKGNKVTTLFAEAKQAYVLMDRATYLTLKKQITLVPLVEGDPLLMNYIAVIAVNPQKFQGIHAEATQKFMDWLVGDEAQSLIKEFRVNEFGEPLFFPNSNQWKSKHGE